MFLQSVRPVLLSALVILLGVAQIFCACANADASVLKHTEHQMERSEAVQAEKPHCDPKHAAGASHTEKTDKHKQHTGDHEHAADCAHCNDANVLVGANNVISPVSLPSPADEEFLAPTAQALPVTRALMAPNALDGLRWLHPPSYTLVTLKIRLTI